MPQGRNYINKMYFDLDKNWTMESIMQKLDELGLTLQQALSPSQFNTLKDRGNYNLVLYTHRSKDTPTVLRRSYIKGQDMEWYTSREWEEVSGGKVEIPY